MSIVIQQGGQWVAGNNYIGYDSLYLRSDAVVSASAEDTGFPAENATSWLTYSGGWRTSISGDQNLAVSFPSTEAAGSFGLFKHNLGDIGGTVKLQESDDGITWNDITGSSFAPTDNRTIFFVFTEETHPYWRLVFNVPSGETLIVGQAFIGPAMQLFGGPESGFTPPNLAFNDDFVNSRADGGDFLGRSLIRKGAKTGFSVSAVAAAWIRSTWEPFLETAQLQPFYFSWNSADYPTEVAYCYTEDNVAKPTYQSAAHMTIRLDFIALIE